eukprot:m.355684 g.355684  ORF g.355684 m.355684 type:complete len:150 (+) comp17306_c0_seq1:47-496(+)
MAEAPAPRQGGWGDGKKSRHQSEAVEEDERLKMDAPVQEEVESDDEIPEIRDLDEEQAGDEDITTQVADAPSANVQVATMADLDKELSESLPFQQTQSGIDLKLLINNLTPSHLLKEVDKEWEFVPVFTQIKSELAQKTAAIDVDQVDN